MENHVFSQISVAPAWLWIAFTLGILILLLVDLSFFGRRGHRVSSRVALAQSCMWIAIALCFNLWFAFAFGKDLGFAFLTGYLLEKSLSVDNLFVILLVFSSFKISAPHQHRVLFFGVLGAIVFRALFIVLGAHIVNEFHWVLYGFGLFLVITAVKFLRNSDEKVDVRESRSLRLLKKVIPTTSKLDHDHFFIREKGIRKATPLLLALVVVEGTDLIFAVDSIPAVFAVTQDAFVAFASNILAILGLRSLYFVLASWVGQLRYLKPGLAAVLGFVGFKMLLMDFVSIPNWVSLLVIFSILLTASLGSWYSVRLDEKK